MTTYQAKSITIGRKRGEDREGPWSAFIGLFDQNNPHLSAQAPKEVLEIKEIEKVRIRDLRNVSYYLMGSDVVINDLTELSIEVSEGILTITGKQEL